MDLQTAEYYRDNALACMERYEAAEMGRFHAMLRRLTQPSCRVLDIGGGSGRDAAFLASLGCEVTYTDGCEDMVRAASERHPVLKDRCRVAEFPLMPNDPLLTERFGVVLCIAVLMHLPDAEFRATVAQIVQLTASSGCVVTSHSIGRCGLTDSRDSTGRLFRERSDAEVTDAFTSIGMVLETRTFAQDSLGRTELGWLNLVLRKGF